MEKEERREEEELLDTDVLSPSRESILLEQPTKELPGRRAVWNRDVIHDRDEWMKFVDTHKKRSCERRASMVNPAFV